MTKSVLKLKHSEISAVAGRGAASTTGSECDDYIYRRYSSVHIVKKGLLDVILYDVDDVCVHCILYVRML